MLIRDCMNEYIYEVVHRLLYTYKEVCEWYNETVWFLNQAISITNILLFDFVSLIECVSCLIFKSRNLLEVDLSLIKPKTSLFTDDIDYVLFICRTLSTCYPKYEWKLELVSPLKLRCPTGHLLSRLWRPIRPRITPEIHLSSSRFTISSPRASFVVSCVSWMRRLSIIMTVECG